MLCEYQSVTEVSLSVSIRMLALVCVLRGGRNKRSCLSPTRKDVTSSFWFFFPYFQRLVCYSSLTQIKVLTVICLVCSLWVRCPDLLAQSHLVLTGIFLLLSDKADQVHIPETCYFFFPQYGLGLVIGVLGSIHSTVVYAWKIPPPGPMSWRTSFKKEYLP